MGGEDGEIGAILVERGTHRCIGGRHQAPRAVNGWLYILRKPIAPVRRCKEGKLWPRRRAEIFYRTTNQNRGDALLGLGEGLCVLHKFDSYRRHREGGRSGSILWVYGEGLRRSRDQVPTKGTSGLIPNVKGAHRHAGALRHLGGLPICQDGWASGCIGRAARSLAGTRNRREIARSRLRASDRASLRSAERVFARRPFGLRRGSAPRNASSAGRCSGVVGRLPGSLLPVGRALPVRNRRRMA